jgi:hypothetical protein
MAIQMLLGFQQNIIMIVQQDPSETFKQAGLKKKA